MRIASLAASALAVATVAAALTLGSAYGKDDVKPFISLPKTWEAGVEEAKLLNVPIVVHSHGWN